MKIQVTQEKLAKALSLVGRVAQGRQPLPVLSNILIKAAKNRIQISSTNLEVAITQYIGGKVEEEGAITVPARLMGDFVNGLPKENITLTTDANKVIVTAAKHTSTINGISADEFPSIPTISNGTTQKVPAAKIAEAIQQTVFAASSDDTRPVLTGVYFYTHENKMMVVATDSYRLAEKNIGESKNSFKLLIPASSMGDLARIIHDGEEGLEIIHDDTQVFFRAGDSEIITRQIDGEFPQYKSLIPASSDVVADVDRQELLGIVKIASLFARESAGGITLSVSEKTKSLSISSIASQVGENSSQIDAKAQGEGEVTLNSRYLLDALNALDEADVQIRFSGKLSPVVISTGKKPDYLHVIMPLKS
jgi:DNA polymerase-3 subunit beta